MPCAGQIGSTLVKGLAGKYHLRGLDIRPTSGLEDSVVGDVREFETVLRAAKGMNAIVHLANVSTGAEDRWEDLVGNMTGTYNVLEAARQSGVRRVVYASRAGLLSPYPTHITRTVDLLPRPNSFYSVGKVVGEKLACILSILRAGWRQWQILGASRSRRQLGGGSKRTTGSWNP